MSRARLIVVAVVLVVFAAAGGYLVYGNGAHAGQNVTVNLTVIGARSMTPTDLSAHQNDSLTINIASDTDGEVHLHGYDLHFDTRAGQVVSHSFKAINTGDFEFEWESTSTHLGHLVVT